MVFLNKCCCWFNLTTGGVILGWLGVLDSLFCLAVTAIGLFDVDEIVASEKEELSKDTLIIVLVLYGAVNLLTLIASALLIMGTFKRNPLYLLPWLICEMISIAMLFFSIIGQIANDERFPDGEHVTWRFTMFVVLGLTAVGLQVYLYICIYSLYQLFKSETGNRRESSVQASHLVLRDEFKDSLPPYSTLSSS